jgi:hypothetical protein
MKKDNLIFLRHHNFFIFVNNNPAMQEERKESKRGNLHSSVGCSYRWKRKRVGLGLNAFWKNVVFEVK